MSSDLEAIFHGDYDPEYARQYYLRNRKLKGRKKGSVVSTPTSHRSTGQPIKAGRVAKSTLQQKRNASTKRRNAVNTRVKELQAKLKQLEQQLDKLIAQAKSRNGGSSPSKDSKTSSSRAKSGQGERKLTASQKSDARKRSKDYYEKNKKPAKPKQNKEAELEAKIKVVRQQIAKAREDLADAVMRARTQTTKRA